MEYRGDGDGGEGSGNKRHQDGKDSQEGASWHSPYLCHRSLVCSSPRWRWLCLDPPGAPLCPAAPQAENVSRPDYRQQQEELSFRT